MPVIPVEIRFPSVTLPSVSFPSFTQNATLQFDLPIPTSSPNNTIQIPEPTLTTDNVVAGLAAIGLNKGWVIVLQVVLVIVCAFTALLLLASCAITCTEESYMQSFKKEMSKHADLEEKIREFKEFKKFKKLYPNILDVEKGLGDPWEKAQDEAIGEKSDTASFKTCAV